MTESNLGDACSNSTAGGSLAQAQCALPEAVIRSIAARVVSGDASGSMLINLMSLCGVCTQWRRICREVESSTCISFDGLDVSFSNHQNVLRFRRASPDQKQEFFICAARLLTGHHSIMLTGEGITDRVLEVIASKSNTTLKKICIQAAHSVSDNGLKLLVMSSPKLQELLLDDLKGSKVEGGFLVTVFENCCSLSKLQISNVPAMKWINGVDCPGGVLWGASKLQSLHLRSISDDAGLDDTFAHLPYLESLELDGSPENVHAAAAHCTRLQHMSYVVASNAQLDDALSGLLQMRSLTRLEIIVKHLQLSRDQLARIGAVQVHDLRLLSYAYKQQPSLSRAPYSHLDNEGVKALVDAICSRWSLSAAAAVKPLRLSLCGATSLTHDAVSILLRLPVLTDLDITGCCRITAMDKMRLVAKVRAGQEMLLGNRNVHESHRSTGPAAL